MKYNIINMFNFKNLSDNNLTKNDIKEIILQTRRYPYLKADYNIQIPLKVYMTWHTKNLPPKMLNNLNKLKLDNPKFEFIVYDDNDCREFIKNNYSNEILWAFDKLKPGAYKADLWRLCILYKYGGYYLDIKYGCINGFKLVDLSEKEHFVLDRPKHHIYNAIMICKKDNPFLLNCIEQIIQNIKNNYYGISPLAPTGPGLLGEVALKYNYNLNVDMRHPNHGKFIVHKGVGILKPYDGYLEERESNKRTDHYTPMWNRKDIYNL